MQPAMLGQLGGTRAAGAAYRVYGASFRQQFFAQSYTDGAGGAGENCCLYFTLYHWFIAPVSTE